jgi:Tol biopolymer transport system component
LNGKAAVLCLLGALAALLAGALLAMPDTATAVDSPFDEGEALDPLAEVYPTLTPYAYIPLVERCFSEGGIIAFETDRAGKRPGSDVIKNYDIFVMSGDGSCVRNFTNNPDHDETTPAWSADGRKLAYTAYITDTNGDGQITYGKDNGSIYTVNRDGSGKVALTNPSTNDQWPTWSPDGTRIAFQTWRHVDGDVDIYVMNADGTGLVRLTSHIAADRHPSWSPDGSKIAFTSNRTTGYNDIFTMNTDGSNKVCLTCFDGKVYDDYYADWLPDGRIIFNSGRELVNMGAYVMNADGSNQTMIGSTTLDYAVPNAASEDGSRIIFYARRGGGKKQIYSMNLDGSNETNLSRSASDDEFCDWAPAVK